MLRGVCETVSQRAWTDAASELGRHDAEGGGSEMEADFEEGEDDLDELDVR